MKPLEEEDRIGMFRTVYRALHILGEGDPGVATPATASLRLLLIDALGEERQRELIGGWNEELPRAARERALYRLAQEGIAFAFVSAGMPVEWARRHTHLFQYMPPMHAPLDENTCVECRRAQWEAANYAGARDAGNMLLALAVLAGNADAIRRHATDNLHILEAWGAEERNLGRDLGRDYEFEEHAWLRDQAEEMAQWGQDARLHL